MSSMVSTVLDIERQAEDLIRKAAGDAKQVLEDAAKQRDAAAAEAAEKLKKELVDIEANAKSERERKVKELTASGEAALSAVKNVSDNAFDAGVQHVMKALSGE